MPVSHVTGFSPLKVAGVLLAIVCALAVLGALGFKYDPFGLQARRLEQTRDALATASANAAAADIEAGAARDATTRVEIALTQSAAAHERLTDFAIQTRNAPDATEPLDSDRTDRLRDFDQQLCAIRPAICAGATGGSPADRNAADGETALPAGRAPSG